MRSGLKICAVILLIAGATASVAEPLTLAYKYKVGEIDKYRMSLWLSLDVSQLAAATGKPAPPSNVAVTMTMTQKTLAVYSDGSAKVRIIFGSPQFEGVKVPPEATKSMQKVLGQGMVMTLSKRGLPRSIQSIGNKAVDPKMGKFDCPGTLDVSSLAFLPEGPVEVGQTWTANIPMPFANSQFYFQSVLAGADEEIWNIPVARIKQSCSGRLDLKEMLQSVLNTVAAGMKQPMPDLSSMSGFLTLQGEMTHYFAPSMGKLLKREGVLQARLSVTMPPAVTKQGAPGTLALGVDVQMAMTRFR